MLSGKTLHIVVPKFTPHKVNTEGDIVPMMSSNKDRNTGEITSEESVLIERIIFLDEIDLKSTERILVRMMENEILPFAVESEEVIFRVGAIKTGQTVKEASTTDEPIPERDENGNLKGSTV